LADELPTQQTMTSPRFVIAIVLRIGTLAAIGFAPKAQKSRSRPIQKPPAPVVGCSVDPIKCELARKQALEAEAQWKARDRASAEILEAIEERARGQAQQ
jgi:hypothetical protein